MEEEKKSKASRNTNDEAGKSSRRDFMKSIGLVGAAAVTGGAAIYSGYKYEKDKGPKDTVRVLTEDNKLVEIPVSEIKKVTSELKVLQSRGRQGIAGRRWVMVIDLAKCRNARQCVAACQSAHHLRPYEYHINTLVMQENETSAPYFMPKPCQHCDNPPCVSVCPVDATFKRPDGIVLIDNERCIGCRFCIAACPYSARIFHWETPKIIEGDEDLTYDVELNVPQRKGTVTKCLFSADRVREGHLPYCVSACPNGVFYFGDENEDSVTNGTTKQTVRLSLLLKDNAGYRLMPELGTQPRVYYLPPKNRLFEFPEDQKPGMHDTKHI